MPTTTLKLADALKQRVADAAEQLGKSPHAFMVDAIEAETRRAEVRSQFVASALRAEQEVATYGEVYSMDEVHKYFNDRLAGKAVKRPKPRNIRD